MRKEDRDRFIRVLAGLCVAFNRENSEILLDVYWEALDDLSIEALERAAREAVRESKFMPPPAELRDRTGANNVAAIHERLEREHQIRLEQEREDDYQLRLKQERENDRIEDGES